METLLKLKETESYIRNKTDLVPSVGLILGSGLGDVFESSREDVVFNYNELPHFSGSTVEGHSGKLILGKLDEVSVAVMQGRLHYYEGYSLEEVVYPIRLMKHLGINFLLITAAAGALNVKYQVGNIVIIKDHLNFMGVNCLRGKHYPEFGERFPDTKNIYDADLRRKAARTAVKHKVKTREGVYLAVPGPSYETSSEVKAYRKLGGDVIGMSVVPEAVCAKQMRTKVLALSYVSNKAGSEMKHSDVVETGKAVSAKMAKIIYDIVKELG
ncbi:MAG: purine-nucleoside phosphorylase [Endomicrobiales bacterium]|nr:purine-nucleoside phosphorylase [Endomicrobiales bacterium]